MRSFNSTFNTERAKRGTAPVNLLVFEFPSGGFVYLSDRDVTPSGGSAHLGLVKEWGFIDHDKASESGLLGGIEVPDLALTIINSGTPPFSSRFAADTLESVPVKLYQWFAGTADSTKELIFRGYNTGVTRYTLAECQMTIGGLWSYLDRRLGDAQILTTANYPSIDPDDVGRMANIIYGAVDHVPCRCVESGGLDFLAAGVLASTTTLDISDATEFLASGTVQIENEKITYTGKSGNSLTGCTRGASSTTATVHDAGAGVWQVASRYVYQVAGHPVSSIGECFVDGVRVTSVATKYTGQAGSELTGFAGQAVFTVPARITRQQAVDLLIADGQTLDPSTLGVLDQLTLATGVTINDTTSVSSNYSGALGSVGIGSTGSHSHTPSENPTVPWKFDTIITGSGSWANLLYAIDYNSNTYAQAGTVTATATLSKALIEGYGGPPTQYRLCVSMYTAVGTGINLSFYGRNYSNSTSNSVGRSGWYSVDSTGDTWAEFVTKTATISAGSTGNCLIDAWIEVQYAPAVASGATGVSVGGTPGGTVASSRTASTANNGAVTKGGSLDVNGTITKTGSITISGNSVADVEIGKAVTAHAVGRIDDGSGTYTGTPGAVVSRPDHVLKHLWAAYLGGTVADFSTTASTYFGANSYAFGLLIDEPVQFSDLFASLAMQCRGRFLVRATGEAALLLRQTIATSQKSITKDVIKANSVAITRTDRADLLNTFTLFYDRDNRLPAAEADSYNKAKAFVNSGSVTDYGTRTFDGDDATLCLDAVRGDAMAQDVGAFYLEWYRRVRVSPEFAVFLDSMEIEPGDVIDVTHDLDSMAGMICEVVSVRHVLGSGKSGRADCLELVAVSIDPPRLLATVTLSFTTNIGAQASRVLPGSGSISSAATLNGTIAKAVSGEGAIAASVTISASVTVSVAISFAAQSGVGGQASLMASAAGAISAISALTAGTDVWRQRTAGASFAAGAVIAPAAAWTQSAPLAASDAAATDQFGTGVALSADGTVMAVGAKNWEDATSGQGGVYIYDRVSGAWVQRGSVLVAGDAAVDDNFGKAVALSADGTILAVGAINWEGAVADQGGVYIYDWSGSAWVQRGSVLISGDSTVNADFGKVVALSADGAILAVGISAMATGLSFQGGVFIYDWSGSAWVQRGSVLTASDAAAGDFLGSSVALSADGSVLATGATGWEGAVSDQGGVYIYDWSGSAWVQRGAVLAGSDAAAGDFYGEAVALSADGAVLAVGAVLWEGANNAQGGVYVYDWSGSAWVQRGPVLTVYDAAISDNLGGSAALSADGTILAVGAINWENATDAQGGVYIFTF